MNKGNPLNKEKILVYGSLYFVFNITINIK